MKVVKDVMTADAITVTPEMTLHEAAELLSSEGIGGAPVVTGDRMVVGVISVADILDFMAESPGMPTERELSDEWDDLIGDPDETSEVYDLWDDGDSDVLERFREAFGPEWNVLDEHPVGEVMSRRVISIEPDASLEEAARKMLENRVRRLLVMDGRRLLGIVTQTDLVADRAGV